MESCLGEEDIMKHYFSKMVILHWNRLPGDVVDAPPLSVVIRYLDKDINNTFDEGSGSLTPEC